MTTITVRTTVRPAATRFERVLLDGSATLEAIALRHMHRRTAAADVERRREQAADARRDAQAAGSIQLLPR